MGVKITHRPQPFASQIKTSLAPVMKKVSAYLMSSANRKINAGVPPANAPLTQEVKKGDKTLRDTGLLMASIHAQNTETTAQAATNLVYAKILQEGGTIKTKGKGLWIPASAKTRQLMRSYNASGPGDLITKMKNDGYQFFKTPKGGVFCAYKKKSSPRGRDGKPFALFLIKGSVTIPARPFLHIDDKDERFITTLIRGAILNSLKGDGK